MNEMLPQADAKLSRRERERLRRRQTILRAAQAVFAEKGYARATLDEIAERAEFGKGTLYNYFEGGKEEMLFSIFDEIYDGLTAIIDASFGAEDNGRQSMRDQFHRFVEATFSFFLDRKELFMILTKEEHRFVFSEDSEKAGYFRAQHERGVNLLVPALETAMERGTLKTFPPQAVAHVLLGNIHGLMVHCSLSDESEACEKPILNQPDKAADFLTTVLFDGLLARPTP